MDLVGLFTLDPNFIIEYMDSLLDMVFNTAQNSILHDWGNKVILEVAEDTEKQVTNQLGYNP